MKYRNLSEFQEQQKRILAMLPPAQSKIIDFSKIVFDGKSDGKIIFKAQGGGMNTEDLYDAIGRNLGILEFFDEPSLDASLVYNNAFFSLGKHVIIDKEGDYEIALETDGKNVVKNVIIVEEGVQCTLFLRLLGKGDLNIVNHVFVKKESKCRMGFLNELDGLAVGFNRGFVEESGRLDLSCGHFGSGMARFWNEHYLLGDHASGNIFDIYSCQGEMEMSSRVYCKAKGNKSLLLSKGIISGLGKVFFEGYAKIEKNAEDADLFVGEHALILEKGAKAHLVPNLEIENNNVRAGHAASVLPVDDEKMFYLQSRGLDEGHARKLFVEGFLLSVVEKMEMPSLEKEILRRMQ